MSPQPTGLLVLGLVACIAFAQDPGSSVAGVVLDGETAQPVQGVLIEIAEVRTSTAADGSFELVDLPGGQLQLSATKDGYLAARLDDRVNSRSGEPLVTLAPGQQIEDLVLYMFPAGVVTGRVFDSTGQPLRRASVVPYRMSYDDKGDQQFLRLEDSTNPINLFSRLLRGSLVQPDPQRVRGGLTNDRGEYRIFNLEPGRYVFAVESGVSDLFYPGVTEVSRATVVDVSGGVETVLDDTMLFPLDPGTIRVRVVNQLGTPANAAIYVRRSGAPGTLVSLSVQPDTWQELGRFPTGSYIVEAVLSVQSERRFIASSRRTVDLFGQDADVEIPVSVGRRLDGTLYMGDSVLQRPGLMLELQSDEVLPDEPILLISRPDGTFGADSIPNSLFRVRSVSGIPDGICLNAVLQGDRNVLRDGLLVAGGPVEFRVVFEEPDARVSGIAWLNESVSAPGAKVVLVPSDVTQTHMYRSTTVDQNGRYAFPCVLPGVYDAFGWQELEDNAYRNADFMAPYRSEGIEVVVESDTVQAVDLTVFPR